MTKRRVGVVGYGHLGQYLTEMIQGESDLELAFVWNRTLKKVQGHVTEDCILENLEHFCTRDVDIIVEVAHPTITQQYGEDFLKHCDFLIGSPSALADSALEQRLRAAASQHSLYVPAGAFWGGEDISRMATRGSLQRLVVTMTKHPSCFKLHSPLKEVNEEALHSMEPVTLYQGPVRQLCHLAPNNVNTMAAAAVAAHNLGFDDVEGRLIADSKMKDWHIVQVDAWGPGDIAASRALHVHTERRNPAGLGVVTGSATFGSFASSLRGAHSKGPGVHLC